MNSTDRRGFLGRLTGAAAALGLPLAAAGRAEARQASGADAWLGEVKGKNRCFFDFPRHNNGMGLMHILNYISTYQAAYKAAPGTVGAVGTFYGIGPGSSIAMGFNDAMWAKYGLGEYHSLKDGGKPYTRNPFNRMTKNELPMLMQAAGVPPLPPFAEAMPSIGIDSLQKMGAKFLMCANALGAWCVELEVRGKGKAPEIEKELRANLLPGVTIVPAMVIAIEKAQGAGLAYNRQ